MQLIINLAMEPRCLRVTATYPTSSILCMAAGVGSVHCNPHNSIPQTHISDIKVSSHEIIRWVISSRRPCTIFEAAIEIREWEGCKYLYKNIWTLAIITNKDLSYLTETLATQGRSSSLKVYFIGSGVETNRNGYFIAVSDCLTSKETCDFTCNCYNLIN